MHICHVSSERWSKTAFPALFCILPKAVHSPLVHRFKIADGSEGPYSNQEHMFSAGGCPSFPAGSCDKRPAKMARWTRPVSPRKGHETAGLSSNEDWHYLEASFFVARTGTPCNSFLTER